MFRGVGTRLGNQVHFILGERRTHDLQRQEHGHGDSAWSGTVRRPTSQRLLGSFPRLAWQLGLTWKLGLAWKLGFPRVVGLAWQLGLARQLRLVGWLVWFLG